MQFLLDRFKRPAEDVPVGIDFVDDLALLEGDTPVSVAVAAFDKAGTDVTTSFIASSGTVGSVGQCVTTGGSDGDDITVYFKMVTTLNPGGYIHSIVVPVRLNS